MAEKPASEKKSDIFAETKMPGALTLQALKPDEPIPGRKRPTGLENEIKERLARKVTGMQEGETGAVGATSVGDGATSTGAFHEALNLAAVEKLP